MLVLLLALSSAALAEDGQVRLPLQTWLDLQPPTPDRRVPAPRPLVSDRTVTLRATEGGVLIDAVWRLEPTGPGWLDVTLAGPAVRVEKVSWDGRIPAISAGDGTRATVWVDRPSTLRMTGFIEGDPDLSPVTIPLLAATRGRVDAGAWAVLRDGAPAPRRDGRWWNNGDILVSRPPEANRDRVAIGVASVGIGLTVGESDVQGKAHVRYALRQGTTTTVGLRVPGIGADLTVSGPDIERWERAGDAVTVTLRRAATSTDLELSWSDAIGAAIETRLPVPAVSVDGAFRSEGSLQLARDGEIEVLPEVSGEPIAAADLPSWGRGLVAGTPTAAYASANAVSGALSLLRFVPAESPALLVDVANHTIAITEDGRMLSRTFLTVRNQRLSHLRLRPPGGSRIFGVRVAGEVVVPAVDDDGTWLVPLKRSVETAKGLISFPVEISAVGAYDEAWRRHEIGEVPLMSVDAPVAVSRVTVHLPPGWRDRGEQQRDRVPAFNEGEGITYGLSGGDEVVAQADQMFQDAVSSWMKNDFDDAQAKLEALKGIGASNENIERLQSNLDILGGKHDDGAETVVERRVKDEVRSRAAEDFRRWEQTIEEADKRQLAGDYAGASSGYARAAEVGEKLAKIEQKESMEQKKRNAVNDAKLSKAKEKVENQGFIEIGLEEEEGEPEDTTILRFSGVKKPPAPAPVVQPVQPTPVEPPPPPPPPDTDHDGILDDTDSFGDEELIILEVRRPIIRLPRLARPAPKPKARVMSVVADTPEDGDGSNDLQNGTDDAEGQVGGVEGGVVGGVVGGEIAEPKVTPTDPVTGTFSLNFNYDRIDDIPIANTVPVAREPGYLGPRATPTPTPSAPPATTARVVRTDPTNARATVVTKEFLESVPTGRSYQTSTSSVAGVVRAGGIDGKVVAVSPFDDKPREIAASQAMGGGASNENRYMEEPPKLPDVYASALSVVIPALGETIRFQHLLLPPGQAWTVPIDVRRNRD